MSARDEILGRVRDALEGREAVEHPGGFGGWRAGEGAGERGHGGGGAAASVVERFTRTFEAAGGEVVRLEGPEEATAWLEALRGELEVSASGGVSVGATVPASLTPGDAGADPEGADLGVSMATGAVAETGSLVLDARDGRRAQLLPPVHVVWVKEEDVHDTLVGALHDAHEDLPSAVGLHSGPSKSADLGQILVKGVHGPGRVVAALVGRS